MPPTDPTSNLTPPDDEKAALETASKAAGESKPKGPVAKAPPMEGRQAKEVKEEGAQGRGPLYRRKTDNEVYALMPLRPDNRLGRTHLAKNKVHTWEGTQDQFIREFRIEGQKATEEQFPPSDVTELPDPQ